MNNKINYKEWSDFKISDLFTLKKGKCSNAPDLEDGNDMPYVGAKKTENGVMKWIKTPEKNLISKGNCIAFICQGAGSNGFNNYFDIDTVQTTSNVLGYNAKLNKFNALFIVTVLDLERPKWSFGRGRAPKLKETIIKLPSKNSQPDWEFMEKFMKSIFEQEKSKLLSKFI